MKFKLSSNLYPTLFALILALCLPNLSQAQLTIHNRTACTIYIQASQVDNGSGQPCTPCNVSSFTAIAPGGTWVHPGDASCGHYRWLGVRWYLQAGGPLGVSYNPIWQGTCGQSTRGDRCNGTATFARWDVPSSPGPATVVIR